MAALFARRPDGRIQTMLEDYNGEAEFPPVEQGTSEALGLLAVLLLAGFVSIRR